MEQLTDTQKRKLKKQAHSLKPLIRIGKNGLNLSVIRTIDKSLTDHELFKIKFLVHKSEKNNIAALIAKETGSHIIDNIGNTLVIYRQSSNPKKRKINLRF
jgi:RNA-binding protein